MTATDGHAHPLSEGFDDSTPGVFETSGHLGGYADGMYPPMEMDNGTYYMKPMNCPIHCLIYKSRQRSYRELPLRLFELGNVYRYERAGTVGFRCVVDA